MHFFRKLGLQLVRMGNKTIFLTTILFIIFCTFIINILEPDTFGSLLDAFYFVMTTFATVGYGDFSPVTVIGKLFTVLMYLVGIGLLGVVIGKIIDTLTIYRRKREEGKVAYTKGKHIVIIGWSKKTDCAVKEILNSDSMVEMVIIDTLSKSPIDIEEHRVHYIQGDLSEEETFYKANLQKAETVIIFSDDSIPDSSLRDAKTLTVAIMVERLASNVHTIVEILSAKNISNFSHVKVDEFILSEETISRLAVRSAMYKGISKVFSQLISRQDQEDLYKITKKENWVTYEDAFKDLLQQGATLIADRDKLDINRRLHETIPKEAELYVICNQETYKRILQLA